MGVKLAPTFFIDAALQVAGSSTWYCICSGSPATYTDAYTNFMLARIAVSSGSFTYAADSSGRKVTMTAAPSIPITNSGFAEAVVLVSSADSTLRFRTTCTGQQLTAGGTVDAPAWKINITDPT